MKPFFISVVVFVLLLSPLRNNAQMWDFSEIDKLLQDSLSALGGTGQADYGGVCLIISVGDAVVYKQSYNLPNKTVSEDRLMPIASASKWSSGLVIMGLVQDGKLSLDDTCGTFFPNLSPEKASISIRQLFTFTSGFPGNLTGPTACVDDLTYKGTLEECVQNVFLENLTSSPGQYLNYGSNSMQIAGRIAELVSGLPYPSGVCWDSLYAQYVKKPLRMVKTGFDIPILYSTLNPRIDGGVFSTAQEYLAIPQMIIQKGMYNGVEVLKPEFLNMMISDQTRNATILYSPYMQFPNIDADVPKQRYGIGCWLEKKNSTNEWYDEVSSQGRFGFSPFAMKQFNVAGVLAVKSNEVSSVYPTYYKLKQLLREIFTKSSVVSEVKTLVVYPNPTNGILNLNGIESNEEISVYSVTGTEVFSTKVSNSQVDISSLANGVYSLRSKNNNQIIVKY